MVAVAWDQFTDKLVLVSHHIWKPTPLNPLDIEGTIEWYLRQLHSSAWIEKIVCDPYQLHRSITTLQQAGMPIEEYPQNVPNCTRMGQGYVRSLERQEYPALCRF